MQNQEQMSTGKSFTLSTTLDTNPFLGNILPSSKPPIGDSLPFTKDIIFDPVLGRQIFVQNTSLGPIATVPTILPNQVQNVTEAYNQTVKKLIDHVPTSSAILRDSKVFARRQEDGFFYPAVVAEHVEGNTFIVEFEEKYVRGLRMQKTPSFDMIAYDDAMRHTVGEGDHCLAPIDNGPSAFLPAQIIYDEEAPEGVFKVKFCSKEVKNVAIEKVCWIPSVLYDRLVAELVSPEARIQTIQNALGSESHSVHHPLDIFLNGTPKYMLGSGIPLPAEVISRAWYPVSYQGVRYIPTFPVPWLPYLWPHDVTLWPQFLLPFRRTFAAVDTHQRLPGMKMSVKELDQKLNHTLNESKSVLESTSGSYLERMDSFLAKHDNEEIAQILSDNTDENYEVDIDWSKIPHKETADVGENTVVSLRNRMCQRRWKINGTENRKPWIKYCRVEEEKAPLSVVRSGPFDEHKKPYGYSDDDYTLWRLKQKQINKLEALHRQKTEFIQKETDLVRHQEADLKNKIEQLDKKVKKAESFFVQN